MEFTLASILGKVRSDGRGFNARCCQCLLQSGSRLETGQIRAGHYWSWRRKFARLLLVLKSCGLVRAIAKGLVRGVPATAKSDCRAAAKAVGSAFHVDEFEFPFDAQRPIIPYDDLRGGILLPLLAPPHVTA